MAKVKSPLVAIVSPHLGDVIHLVCPPAGDGVSAASPVGMGSVEVIGVGVLMIDAVPFGDGFKPSTAAAQPGRGAGAPASGLLPRASCSCQLTAATGSRTSAQLSRIRSIALCSAWVTERPYLGLDRHLECHIAAAEGPIRRKPRGGVAVLLGLVRSPTHAQQVEGVVGEAGALVLIPSLGTLLPSVGQRYDVVDFDGTRRCSADEADPITGRRARLRGRHSRSCPA